MRRNHEGASSARDRLDWLDWKNERLEDWKSGRGGDSYQLSHKRSPTRLLAQRKLVPTQVIFSFISAYDYPIPLSLPPYSFFSRIAHCLRSAYRLLL